MRRPVPSTSRWLVGAAAGLAAATGLIPGFGQYWLQPAALGQTAQAPIHWFTFARDNVLGTSFDLVVGAVRPDLAAECEARVLAEIERLRGILSTYDPASEISRVSREGAAIQSPELREVLDLYGAWAQRTGGALSAHLGGVSCAWAQATQTGRFPSAAELSAAKHGVGALNVDALGKGFILERAVAVARRLAPTGLLNIGGDLRAWGETAWPVAIADPLASADNALPLRNLLLREAAVAASGGYARFYEIAGRRYSHLLDPRTLAPVARLVSAAAVAADAVTANALATASCVLGLPDAARLAQSFQALGLLLTDAAGGLSHASGIFVQSAPGPTAPRNAPGSAPSAPGNPLPSTPTANAAGVRPLTSNTTIPKPVVPARSADSFPISNQVVVNLSLSRQVYGKRPYVAVWVADMNNKLVRTLALWGSRDNYLSELTAWLHTSGATSRAIPYSARATRPAGQYKIVWDGLDARGQPVKKGPYQIFVEVNQEHGRHITNFANLTCADTPLTANLSATVHTDASKIEYGPKQP